MVPFTCGPVIVGLHTQTLRAERTIGLDDQTFGLSHLLSCTDSAAGMHFAAGVAVGERERSKDEPSCHV